MVLSAPGLYVSFYNSVGGSPAAARGGGRSSDLLVLYLVMLTTEI